MLKTHLLKKLFSTFTLLLIICCFFINIITFQIVYYKENTQFKDTVSTLDHTIYNELSDIEENVSTITEQLYTNTFLFDLLHAYSIKDFSQYEAYRLENYISNNMPSSTAISDFMHMLFSSSTSIASITLYSPTLNRTTMFHRDLSINSTYFKIPQTEDSISHLINRLRQSSTSPLSYYKQIALRSNEEQFNFGYLIIEYRLSSIKKFSSSAYKIEATLDPSILSNYYNPSFTLTFPWDTNNLELTVSISNHTIYQNLLKFIFLTALISIGVVSILLIMFMIFFKKMDLLFINILDLIHKNQEGDLSYRINVVEDPKNELTVISSQLNQMNEQLDLYIKTVYVAESKQKQAHILALQNQVNPHFLYNTLEVIRMQALKEGNREIGHQISHLSRLHRNLVKGESHIPLRKELEFCRSYIEIQKIRYKESFTYTIEYDNQIIGYLVPKFILQPIVENYFKYSLDSNCASNHLSIQCNQTDEFIQITITNQGQEVSQDTLVKINQILSNEISTDSIGIQNVQERIRLEYGPIYGLSVTLASPCILIFNLQLPSSGLLCLHKEKYLS